MLLNPIFSNILTHLTYTELLLKPGGWEAVVRVLTRGSYSFAWITTLSERGVRWYLTPSQPAFSHSLINRLGVNKVLECSYYLKDIWIFSLCYFVLIFVYILWLFVYTVCISFAYELIIFPLISLPVRNMENKNQQSVCLSKDIVCPSWHWMIFILHVLGARAEFAL